MLPLSQCSNCSGMPETCGNSRAASNGTGKGSCATCCSRTGPISTRSRPRSLPKSVVGEEFQLWKVTVNPDHTATLACEDGNGKAVYSKAIEYTDFPLPEVALCFTNNTILLPSEY